MLVNHALLRWSLCVQKPWPPPENDPLFLLRICCSYWLSYAQTIFFSFFVFSALPTIIATGDEKLHRNLMRVWGEGNVIRNTLTPLHLWSIALVLLLPFTFKKKMCSSTLKIHTSWRVVARYNIFFVGCVVQYLGERWDRLTRRQKAIPSYFSAFDSIVSRLTDDL